MVQLLIVCGHCSESTKNDSLLEINFADLHIHFLCPSCKKMNKVPMTKTPAKLPKTRVSR
jgi:hypothetical protein